MSTAGLAPAPAVPWLQVRAVSKRYGGVQALRNADLDLIPGEIHGIIGPNGAGKSTLVKILAAAIAPDSGVINLDGEEARFADPAAAQQHRLVLMPQEIAIVPGATVTDNVTLGAEPHRFGVRLARQSRRRAEAALRSIGLDIDPDATAGQLSAVHRRMLMLARAIDRDARLLILDEPTAGLPHHEAELVTRMVRKLMERDITVVYVSHHLSEVAELCDRVTCVREGRVVTTLSGSQVTKDALVNLILDAPPDVTVDAHVFAAHRAEAEPGPGVSPGVEVVGVTGDRLRDVSVVARRGQVTGITGVLGSGVAELVAVIVGASRPLTGSVLFDGADVGLKSPADALDHGVGYLAGDRTSAAFHAMTIRENVSVAALARWFGKVGLIRRRRERLGVSAALNTLSVTADPERLLGQLSGGNQQRALVGRLIAGDVRVLVLDEPTVGVDIRARQELWEAVRALASGRTIIVSSPEPEELVALCERVVCIRHGTVAAVLEGADVTEDKITRAMV